MIVLLELVSLTSIEAFFVSIPETVGLLLFGLILIGAAVLIRRLLGRSESGTSDKAFEKKA